MTHVPTTDATKCISREDLESFIDLVGLTVTRVNENMIIAHATEGDVVWQLDSAIRIFCYSLMSQFIG